MVRIVSLFYVILLSIGSLASNVDGWYFTTMMGMSKSKPSTLSMDFSDGSSEIILARYNNRSFEDSHWWSARMENWKGDTSWGVELIHHKIYLENTNDVIKSFSLSDGYNLLFFNLAKRVNWINYRVGFGVVLAHVDVTIAGRDRFIKKGLTGHYLTGPAFQINVETFIWESDAHFLTFDSKFTAARAEVPISSSNDEFATAFDCAVHFSFGFGSKPTSLSKNKSAHTLSYFYPLVYPYLIGRYVLGTGLLP